MKVKLVRLVSGSPRKHAVIRRFPAAIGRSTDADLFVDDQWTSRWQCTLEVEGDRLIVRDLNSRNGTFVNGKRIDICELRSGDELIVGQFIFRIEYARHSPRFRWPNFRRRSFLQVRAPFRSSIDNDSESLSLKTIDDASHSARIKTPRVDSSAN